MSQEARGLLPCPFCGGTAELREGEECAYVQCLDATFHRGPIVDGDNNAPAEAIAAWNTRAPHPDTTAAVERVSEPYLVWSNEHQAWWGKDRCGYTRHIERAGRYERAEALSIAGTRDGGWHVRKGNPDEIAMPERDAIDQYAAITNALNRSADHA